MLRPRIIPCLLVRNRGLVKTVRFDRGRYIGDPINAVRIFNEKEADELMVLDIDATVNGAGPDLKIVQLWAAECRMPLCYGGGVSTVQQAQALIALGVEKVAVSAAAIQDPELVSSLAREIGSQSVVVVLDVKQGGDYEVWFHNGTRRARQGPVELARQFEQLGAGEIVINSIDRDGSMAGYDLHLARAVRAAISIPLTILGGAGSLADIEELIAQLGVVGAAAGSLFVYKGTLRAVLINYPAAAVKDGLLRNALRK